MTAGPHPALDPRPARWLGAAPIALRLAVAAGAPPGTAAHGEFRRLAARIDDWSSAFAVADGHRLGAFLAHRLRTEAVDVVPAAVAKGLGKRLAGALWGHRVLVDELGSLREMLAANGIPALVYKGPLLAIRLYAPPFLRGCHDLDLFVPADRLEDAVAALGAGWERLHLDHLAAEGDDESHHTLLRHRKSGILTELHRTLAPTSWGVSTASLIGPPESWPAPGADPEDGWPPARLLPALAAHGLRHGYVCLFWLADVAALLARNPAIDWREVWRIAAGARVATALGTSLLLAERIFAVPLPDPQRRRAARDPAARALAVWIEDRIAGAREWDPVQRGVLQTLSIDGWPRRARAALRFAFTPSPLDHELLSLPRGLGWLQSPLRPALVGLRFLRRRATRTPSASAPTRGSAAQRRLEPAVRATKVPGPRGPDPKGGALRTPDHQARVDAPHDLPEAAPAPEPGSSPPLPPTTVAKRDLSGADALVTCMYNGLSGTAYGGRLNRDTLYRESLMTIATHTELRVFCFAPAADIPGHREYFANCPTEIEFIPLELSDTPYHRRIQSIKTADAERYSDHAWQERCVEVMWGKFTMLERVLLAAPEAKCVYWIDAGLANANIISTKYIAEPDLEAHRLSEVAAAFPPRLFTRIREFVGDRILLLESTIPHNPGIPQKYNSRPYPNEFGVVAGLFGGPRERVAELCERFREKVEILLADGVLYFEESILTGIHADVPESFRVFTFDSWYHEGWSGFDPARVNFSNFFDSMLDTPPPERIVKFPWCR